MVNEDIAKLINRERNLYYNFLKNELHMPYSQELHSLMK